VTNSLDSTILEKTLNARDFTVLSFTIGKQQRQRQIRIAALWDADRDTRVLTILIALRFRDPAAFAGIRAIAEEKGRVKFWLDNATPHPEKVRELLQAAADVALVPIDQWEVGEPRLVRCRNGAVDRAALPPDDPLHVVLRRCALGVVS